MFPKIPSGREISYGDEPSDSDVSNKNRIVLVLSATLTGNSFPGAVLRFRASLPGR